MALKFTQDQINNALANKIKKLEQELEKVQKSKSAPPGLQGRTAILAKIKQLENALEENAKEDEDLRTFVEEHHEEWEKHTDKNGNVYYSNSRTGRSVWAADFDTEKNKPKSEFTKSLMF